MTLCDPMDCSPPGSTVPGILQARTLWQIAMPSSRGSSQPRDQTSIFCSSCIGRRFFTISTTWEPLSSLTDINFTTSCALNGILSKQNLHTQTMTSSTLKSCTPIFSNWIHICSLLSELSTYSSFSFLNAHASQTLVSAIIRKTVLPLCNW